MSSSNIENDELDNVPLVRMEDIQPSRQRVSDIPQGLSKDDADVYETYIIDDTEYDNEYVVKDDDDSNIGSMVSLQSEDVFENETLNQELIVPESLEDMTPEKEFEIFVDNNGEVNVTEKYLSKNPIEDVGTSCSGVKLCDDKLLGAKKIYLQRTTQSVNNTNLKHIRESKYTLKECGVNVSTISTEVGSNVDALPSNNRKKDGGPLVSLPSDTWPTLEILPGGVIKNIDKYESEDILHSDEVPDTATNTGEMMYACAKCSQTFKYLFCLVRHVKWHERQKRTTTDPKCKKMRRPSQSDQYICLHSVNSNLLMEAIKRKIPKTVKS